MHKISLLAATALFVAASSFATAARAADNTCKEHKAQAACTADKACVWDASKKEGAACKKKK
jgi:hypothetical protein